MSLVLWLTLALLVGIPMVLEGQAPGVSGPLPPLQQGYSGVRLELTRTTHLGMDGRSWVPVFHGDVAIRNGRSRVGMSLARYPGENDIASSSIGWGLSFTRVLVDQETPARLRWITAGGGTVSLHNENHPGSRAYEVVVGAGTAMRFPPPGFGEALLVLAPRVRWRQMSPSPEGMDRHAAGVGVTGAIDWVSMGRLGLLLALDLDWLSSRPASVAKLQFGFRAGVSYRLLLFPDAHPMPAPEE